ncbi:hypothetical protein [Halorussus lipolyticus]|uniref:hypothetical protein n=1 Tax=Halorussus lipolyticus TaxID=3034024 RepID=UPI0023E8FBEE|nr:hypothetical protein [Halorussus sp. DT80]
MTDRTRFVPRKPITMGSFLVVALVAAALFVPTFSAHVAVMNAVTIDATPTDYALSDDGDHVVVEIRVHNPTRSAFTPRSTDLYGDVDGEQVTGFGDDIEEVTIPAGETKTVTGRVSIKDEKREAAADAIEAGTLRVSGIIRGSITDKQVEIEVTEADDG